MNISKFATKPKLVKITIDDKEIIETYGEVIDFWAYDIVSLTTYFDFFQSRSEQNTDNLIIMMRKLILKEDGTPAIQDDEDLPIDIAIAAMNKLGEVLGKSQGRTSTQEVGTQP